MNKKLMIAGLTIGCLSLAVTFFILSLINSGSNINFAKAAALARPTSGAAGKIVFVKKIIQGNLPVDSRPTEIANLIALKDKFLADGQCNSGLGLSDNNFWVASEDGSSVTPRNACRDSALGMWADGFDANSNSGILPDWSGTGSSFIHEIRGAGENGGGFAVGGQGQDFNRAVLYQISGTSLSPISVGPDGGGWTINGVAPDPANALANYPLIALKNKVLSGSELGRPHGVFSLPGWSKVGSVPVFSGNGSYVVGFGDYAVNLYDGQVFKVSSNSQTLVQTLPGFSTQGYSGAGYTFDNSTWPSKLAIVSWAPSPDWANDHSYLGTIKVYSLGSNGLTLSKTLTVKNAYGVQSQFSVWGNYVAITAVSNHPTVELWDGSTGTKLDDISIPADDGSGGTAYFSLRSPAISKGGYLAVMTSRAADNSVYLYKIKANGTATTPPSSQPPATVGSSTQNRLPLPPPIAGGGACFKQFRNLCDQVQSLRDQLCKLVPQLAFCSGTGTSTTTAPIGGGGGGGGITEIDNRQAP